MLAAELETYTYLDGLVILLLRCVSLPFLPLLLSLVTEGLSHRFLRADPDDSLSRSLTPLNAHIHSVVAELLQVLISRGEAELAGLGAVEAALTSCLFVSIHRGELDLQNKLLHVLHSVIFAISSFSRNQQQPAQSTPVTNGQDLAQQTKDAQPPDLTHDEFFVRLLSDAVSQDNNAIIHHWIDFLLMTIPSFRHQLTTIVLPLIDSLVLRLQTLIDDFSTSYSSLSLPSTSSSITDAEYTALTNALERLILIAVSEAGPMGGDDEVKNGTERPASETSAGGGGAGGLLGYMTGVLSHPEAESTEVPEEIKVRLSPPSLFFPSARAYPS